MAHYSQSPKLLKAYEEGIDTHGMFAMDIFRRSQISDVTPMERFIGKSSWLATVYGCGYKKLLYICENFSEEPLTLDLKPYMSHFGWLPETSRFGDSKSSLRKEHGDDAETIYAQWMFFKNVQDQFWSKTRKLSHGVKDFLLKHGVTGLLKLMDEDQSLYQNLTQARNITDSPLKEKQLTTKSKVRRRI